MQYVGATSYGCPTLKRRSAEKNTVVCVRLVLRAAGFACGGFCVRRVSARRQYI